MENYIIYTHSHVIHLYEFWFYIEEDILKNVGNQTVDSSYWFNSIFFHTMEVNGYS